MLFGIVGFIGSGKNSVADILSRKYSYRKFSFADSLKDAVASIFLWPRGLLEGDNEASRNFREQIDPWWSEKLGYDVTPRIILQKFGTEACRNNIGDNIWIASLEKRMMGYQNVVVTDVRFTNEIDFIRNVGGKVIRVKRGPEPDWWDIAIDANVIPVEYRANRLAGTEFDPDHYLTKILKVHPSEYRWIGTKFDVIIENDGTLVDLEKQVENVLTYYEDRDSIYHHTV